MAPRLDRTIAPPGEPPSRVRVGRGLATGAAPSGGLVVVDERVLALHGLPAALGDLPRLEVVGGEATKSFAELERLLEGCAAAGLDRGSRLVAVGGGVTTDLAGLAAALYMRGIAWTAVPTTLLAQVDASVGGKTAIDLAAGKNLCGAFHAPGEVLVDPAYLATLPRGELLSGLGEVLKAAVLGARAPGAGTPLLDLLEGAPTEALLGPDPDLMTELVVACVDHKADVVAGDPREAEAEPGGAPASPLPTSRKTLNLGHTFGHALELVGGYGRVPHGVAVAAGLHLALAAAARLDRLQQPHLVDRLDALCARLGLPGAATPVADVEAACDVVLDRARLVDAMALDKKGRAGTPRFVLPRAVGTASVGVELEPALLAELLA